MKNMKNPKTKTKNKIFIIIFVISAMIAATVSACSSDQETPETEIMPAGRGGLDAAQITGHSESEHARITTEPTIEEETGEIGETEETEKIEETGETGAPETEIKTETTSATLPTASAEPPTITTAPPPAAAPTTEPPVTVTVAVTATTADPIDITLPVITVAVNGVNIPAGSSTSVEEGQRVNISAAHSSGISEIRYRSGSEATQRVNGGSTSIWYDGTGTITLRVWATAENGTATAAALIYTINVTPKPTEAPTEPAAEPPPAVIVHSDKPGYMKAGWLAAHAMGALDGVLYSNSLEAFRQNYEAGHRVFEVDLQITADGILATLHDHRITPGWTFEQENNNVPFTVMTFEELCYLMLEYPDFYIITDTKYLDDESNKKTFDIIRDTVKATDPALINRIAIQFYTRQMYYFLKENYDFPHENYMYTLYMSRDTDRQVADFVRQEQIRAVVMWYFRVTGDFVTALGNAGAAVYAHTIDDKDEALALMGKGVYGIYTDNLTYRDFDD
jgi:glycerophosphoryl diester phosphodiesterase